MQYYRLNSNSVGSNNTSTQNMLGVGVTLSASAVYDFELIVRMQKTGGTTSHNFQFGFGGTATPDSSTMINYGYTVLDGSTNATGAQINWYGSSTAGVNGGVMNIYNARTTANTYVYFAIRGSFGLNAAGGGTFIPQYTLTAAPGGAYTVFAGSYMKIWPIGVSGANISQGTWS
jgi:hypothetical protein